MYYDLPFSFFGMSVIVLLFLAQLQPLASSFSVRIGFSHSNQATHSPKAFHGIAGSYQLYSSKMERHLKRVPRHVREQEAALTKGTGVGSPAPLRSLPAGCHPADTEQSWH